MASRKLEFVPFKRHAFEEFAPAFATNVSHPEIIAKKDKSMTLSVGAVAPCDSNLSDQPSIILDSVGTFARGQAVQSFLPSSENHKKALLRKRSAKKNVRHRVIFLFTPRKRKVRKRSSEEESSTKVTIKKT